MKLMSALLSVVKDFNIEAFRVKSGNCPLCGKTVFVKYNWDKWSVRCVKCGAAANSMALVSVLKNEINEWRELNIYINSASGPYFSFLKKNCKKLINSLFFPNIKSGGYFNGVQCQDLQNLTFEDNVFDICTSAEIFEHIPNDEKAFKEIFRVLKPGGYHLFTVPQIEKNETVERASGEGENIKYLKPPTYHNDSIRGGKVLCYRDYGRDILNKLSSVGFIDSKIITPDDPTMIGYENQVIFCKKPLR